MANMNTFQVLLSLATNLAWYLQQFDVKNAFLHSDMEEEVYMEAPLGFDDNFGSDSVCRVKKVLYVLKQSPRALFRIFAKVMMRMKYR